MRMLSLLLVGCLIAFSFVIYEVKYETREMDQRVAALRLDIRKERDAIAILRAEWSHLNRPERVERLARKHLGLKPVLARQVFTVEQLAAARTGAPDTTPSRPHAQGLAPALRHPAKAVR